MLKTELESIKNSTAGRHTVTMIDFWHEYPHLVDIASGIFVDDKIDCVHVSLNRLPSVSRARRISQGVKTVIEISPDSHNRKIARASGRGKFPMEQMEEFIDDLLDQVELFEVYFMIGLPEQTETDVRDNLEYCAHLLQKYHDRRVVPYICPMLPFLDPGSEIYDHPQEWGYTLFHETLEEHRKALLSMNWKHRLNYETRWLNRDKLLDISYESVRTLTLLKNKYGKLPDGITGEIVGLIDSTQLLLKKIDAYQEMSPGVRKESAGRHIRTSISEYNRKHVSKVRSQQRPVDFGFTKCQWFDTDRAFDTVMAYSK
jgi:clorobiocin biosynthesis protein CloN6